MVLFSQNKGEAKASSASQPEDLKMTKEKTIAPTWGYRKGKEGELLKQVFNLEEGKSLPDGWVDTPAKCGHAGKEYGA